MNELLAKTNGCENPKQRSVSFYIPCNRPAVSVVATGSRTRRMCAECAKAATWGAASRFVAEFVPEAA